MPDHPRRGRGRPRDDDFDDDQGPPDDGRSRRRPARHVEDEEDPGPGNYGHSRARKDSDADYEDFDEEPRRGSRGAGASSRGGRSGGGGTGGFDWAAADRGGSRGPSREEHRPPPRRRRQGVKSDEAARTLLSLCTPIFGYAAMLPKTTEDPQPPFEQFRRKVIEELRAIERVAPEHGIDPHDAKDAVYALCLFIDEQVQSSSWVAREAWAGEPLHIVLTGDPEGGVHFFDKLEEFGERQKDIKAVFLTCLAMGYRGKYADVDESQQAVELMEIREKLLDRIRSTPMERRRELFPEGYNRAPQIEVQVPPPPRLWVVGSAVLCIASLVLMIAMWIGSYAKARSAAEAIREATREAFERFQPAEGEQAPAADVEQPASDPGEQR